MTINLPDDPKELIKLCRDLHKDFQKLKDKKETALKEAPTLLHYTEELTPDDWAELMKILEPLGHANFNSRIKKRLPGHANFFEFSLSYLAELPEDVLKDMFTSKEISVIKNIAELRKEAWPIYDHIESILTFAVLKEVKLPDDCIEPLEDRTLLDGQPLGIPNRPPTI